MASRLYVGLGPPATGGEFDRPHRVCYHPLPVDPARGHELPPVTHDYLSSPLSFAGLDASQSALAASRYVVLPAPYDRTLSYGVGARFGPAAILDASAYVELYDDVLDRTPADGGIHTLPPLEVVNDATEMVERVQAVVAHYLAQDKWVLMLGGEHSLTPGAVAAYAERFDHLSVLQIDAHADFREEYEGDQNSHACAARRCAEHATLAQVGIRSGIKGDEDALAAHGVTTVWAREIARGGDAWMDRVCDALTEHVYITIDLDGLDPSIMPAVGTPEPGGLDWWTLLRLLHRVARGRRVVGADVMELAPIPGLTAPNFLAAKLAYHVIGLATGPPPEDV